MRRRASLLCAAGAILGLVVLFASMPDIHGLSICSGTPDVVGFSRHEWISFEASGRTGLGPYNASRDATVVVPGCGHGTFDTAFWVRGNHTRSSGDYYDTFTMIVAPTRDGSATRVPIDPSAPRYGNTVEDAFDVTFERKTLRLHEIVFALSLILFGLAASFAWLPIGRFPRIGPTIGLLTGALFMHHPMGYFLWFALPLLVLVAIGSTTIFATNPRGPLSRTIALIGWAFVFGAILDAFAFIDAFPSPVDA